MEPWQPLMHFLPALARTALLALLLSASGCNARTESPRPEAPRRVREPAVAGLFYPAQERLLAQTVDALLESAPVHQFPRLKGAGLSARRLFVFPARPRPSATRPWLGATFRL